MDASFSSIPMSADYSDDCHLLVPRISVTPGVQSFDGTISTVWAAIEISVQLSRPFTDGLLDSHPDSAFLLSNPLRPGSVSRFGYLYNLQVDVIPVQQTTVIEVIQGENKSLNLGSSMLILAKVQIDARQSRQPNKAITQRSNELIADLECELGVPTMRYLQARLRYRHSGFPVSNSIAPINGTIDCQTSLETTVTGVIEQQALNGASALSIASSSGSSLFDIVASYWGPFRANEIFSRKAYDQPITAVKGTTKFSNNLKTTSTEDIPTYQPEKVLDPFTPMPRRPVGIQPSSPDEDPARKIWTEMRRRSSRSRPSAENPPTTTAMSIFGRISANTGSLSSLRMRSEVDRRREVIRDVALRNKRSIGADSLKSLVPSMMNLDVSSKESWGDESSNTSNKENVPPERRKEGRWSIAGWW
ncbi:hypothetical protein GGS24DRAFT_470416 [Hypoxylon argillaceum]|nr:hypothetical protein GGS24DRAFT_470416 [Hypoxylon argillaceum]